MQLIRHVLLREMSVYTCPYTQYTAIENHTHGGHSVWHRRIYIALWEGLFTWNITSPLSTLNPCLMYHGIT